MKIFKKEPNFKFMSLLPAAFTFSTVIILIGIVLFITKGFKLGVDFTGGTLIEVSFKEKTSVDTLRSSLGSVGLGKATIQQVGNENKFLIRTPLTAEETKKQAETGDKNTATLGLTDLIKTALMTEEEKTLSISKLDLNAASELRIEQFLVSEGVAFEEAKDSAQKVIAHISNSSSGLLGDYAQLEKLGLKNRVVSLLKEKTYLGRFTFLSAESVGPQVGQDMQGKAARAAIYSLVGMLIYIAVRFRFIFGLSAMLTLLHDVLATLAFVLMFGIELSLPVIAALLTIVGYSINDTIVIFDRVRDNLKIMRKDNAAAILDASINQTLSRTIITVLTVELTILALFIFGGEAVRGFTSTMLVGITFGCYSSIFQSCAWLKIWEKKFITPKKR